MFSVSEIIAGWLPIVITPLQFGSLGMLAKSLESPVDPLHSQLYYGWPVVLWVTVWTILANFMQGIQSINAGPFEPYKQRLEKAMFPIRIWVISGFWLLGGAGLLYTTKDTVGIAAPEIWDRGLWFVRFWSAFYCVHALVELTVIYLTEGDPYVYFQEQRDRQAREEEYQRLMVEWTRSSDPMAVEKAEERLAPPTGVLKRMFTFRRKPNRVNTI